MQEIIGAVEKYKQRILEAERYLWKNPETGYKEKKTSAYLEGIFRELGYTLTMAEGVPGFYTVVDTGRPGPEILILAEMDSVICPEHKEADPETGAVHSCGHHTQCAALIGVAAVLKEAWFLDKLCGRIKLCAVPAEELLEIEFRRELKNRGVIRYFGGKTEFLSRGYFDGADIAFMVHCSKQFFVKKGSIGCMAKEITYKGVAAHAGGSPWDGRNALYAASCGLNAVNALRETFRDTDMIRVHPIITHGGAMVNAIPDRTRMESYVRGASFDAIKDANHKVNRALCGSALSLGTNVEIVDFPGYAPLNNDDNMIALAQDAADRVLPQRHFYVDPSIGTGCTDMGDLSGLLPVVHPYAGGAEGNSHGSNYYITDPVAACVDSAIWQLEMLHLLLKDDGARAKKIKKDFVPAFQTKEDYFALIDTFFSSGERIRYREDDTAEVCIK